MAGHLLMSDGVFEKAAERFTRPRLRINGETGTADEGGKFDVAHIGFGSCFRFTLTWLGLQRCDEELEAVEQMLAALNRGEIRLGAQKSNGFGRVELKVCKRTFDLTDPSDRAAWLGDTCHGTPLTPPEVVNARRVTFLVSGQADSLLVKAGAALQKEGCAYTPNLTEGGRPILPGSSIKGAVRTRAEMIAGFLGLPLEATENLFGRMSSEGDNGKAGCVFFEDGRLSGEQRLQISRIRINRFTGGIIRGGLFTEEPLSCGVQMHISAPDDSAACGLLLYALRDLGLGLYNLGSGGAIGRGYLSVREIKAVTPDGTEARLIFDKQHRCTVEDPAGIFQTWLNDLGGKRA